jgi:hypothetical protein
MEVKGPSGGPGSDEKEAETGAGEPQLVEGPGYRKVNGRVREQTPYERSSIDPTAQFIVQQAALHGAGKLAAGLLGKALAGTRGGHLAQVVEESAEGRGAPATHAPELRRAWGMAPEEPVPVPDEAAARAADALKYKVLPDKEHLLHMAVAGGGVGALTHHPLLGAIASFLARNVVPIEGTLYRGASTGVLPAAAGAAGAVTGGE